MMIILTDGLDLIVGESEHLVVFRTEDVVHSEVVQSRKDALLGDLHHTGHDTELEGFVTLQR